MAKDKDYNEIIKKLESDFEWYSLDDTDEEFKGLVDDVIKATKEVSELTEFTIKSSNEKEIKRMIKSSDMAHFIWELVHNGWREFKHTDYDYEKAWTKIFELMSDYKIDIDDLID